MSGEGVNGKQAMRLRGTYRPPRDGPAFKLGGRNILWWIQQLLDRKLVGVFTSNDY